MADPDGVLIAAVRAALADAAEPTRAAAMRAYMKSEMAFRGVPKPVRDRALRPVFDRHRLGDRDTWQATALALWREAAYREERYAAIDLTGVRAYAGWQD